MDTSPDDALAGRFAEAYRGRHDPVDALCWLSDPDADGSDGTPGPGRRLRILREAVFRAGASPDAADRLRAAEAEADVDRASAAAAMAVAAAPWTGPDFGDAAPPPDRPRVRRRVRWAVPAAAAILGIVAGFGLGRTSSVPPRPTATTLAPQEAVLRGVVESDGALSAQDYYRLYPDDLPLDWGGASTGVSFRRLHGVSYQQVEPAEVSTELLVVVTCPSADRSYSWSLFTADAVIGMGGGRCGGIDGRRVVLGAHHPAVAFRVQTSGSRPFAASVLHR